jgi:hypothetical protein
MRVVSLAAHTLRRSICCWIREDKQLATRLFGSHAAVSLFQCQMSLKGQSVSNAG